MFKCLNNLINYILIAEKEKVFKNYFLYACGQIW
jgi:hypothetical protein